VIDQAKHLRKIAALVHNNLSQNIITPVKTIKPYIKASLCRSLAVTSGKGGVGKSNTTLSLAVAMTQLHKKVIVFDGDLGLANIHILLGIVPKYTLFHVIQQECNLRDVLCRGPQGITVIPGASGIMSMANLESLQMEKLIRELSELESEYDYLFIDGGAGISQTSIQLSLMADHLLLVITPDPTSLADAYSTAKILFSKGMNTMSVIVNMAETEKSGMELFIKLKLLIQRFIKKDVNLAGIIPYDKNVVRYIRAQKNICAENSSSQFAAKIQNIARKLCGIHQIKERGFFKKILSTRIVNNMRY